MQLFSQWPPDRRTEAQKVWSIIEANLQPGFELTETDKFAIAQVPLSTYPDTYNKQPFQLAALANQKNHLSLYLMCAYTQPWATELLQKSGKKIDMGKSCLRFKKADELPLDEIAEILRRTSVEDYVKLGREARSTR